MTKFWTSMDSTNVHRWPILKPFFRPTPLGATKICLQIRVQTGNNLTRVLY